MIDTKEAYEQRITELVEPVIGAEGMELVLTECLRMKTRWIVRIFIDKPGGVTIDDCSEVSRLVGDILDVHDMPPAAYTLEVSSPGLDRPLVKDGDFLKYRGELVTVRTRAKIGGARNFRGRLMDYVDEGGMKALLLDVGGKPFAIPREAVLHAHLEYDSKK